MQLKRANTFALSEQKIKTTKKPQLLIKSLSDKSLNYQTIYQIYNTGQFLANAENQQKPNYNSQKNINVIDDGENGPIIKLPRIRSSDNIVSDINKNKILKKNLSFFITDENGIKINREKKRIKNYRKKGNKKISNFGEILNFNVFNEKDTEIKYLIDKFNAQVAKKKINKMQRRKNILNKLYGITPEYNNKIKMAKSQKYLPLEEYQDNILTAFNSNGVHSFETMSSLYQKFRNIKTDIESVTPFPKINIKNIINQFKNGIKRKNDKMMRLKKFLSMSKKPQDKFEKDEQKIISLKLKKNNNHISRIQHDNLFILPAHIRKLFIK